MNFRQALAEQLRESITALCLICLKWENDISFNTAGNNKHSKLFFFIPAYYS
ncbi:conserved hypothetical protein [Xenorhabdus nematophila F1]|uniref:Uncharacterized protein n=1 Tax=Xenorhabdus nematophila (strain ATCC 19061 / DSM 3370 / CCUG 14189 / LMG 1036 / NCIMB 9965 / AN6) TaxID=406817 RepID=D3VED5_XENNA|nr:hypothetical protein XNC1_4364 [Xenorhabdus nematophila ATCC 19061]CCW31527.1 conserved hypothetical protein [Xenorhabdus nematophila F1]